MRASELMQKLIAFSRPEKALKKRTTIDQLIKDSVNSALSGSNVTCEISIADDLWAVDCDEVQMKQVIENLIVNAKEAMAEGGRVEVSAENTHIEEKKKTDLLLHEKYIRISIQDQGIGIPEENHSKIFDPYFSTKPRGSQKGTGLGLATAHSIIMGHDGYIEVESEAGFGATFYVYLPAADKRGS